MSDSLALAPTPVEHDLGALRGVTMPTSPGGSGGFLSDAIVQLGFADAGAVQRAVQDSSRLGGTAEQMLLERGAIDEERLARAIAERNGLPFVDLSDFEIDEGATHLIDRSMALRYRAVPIAFTPDGSLLVALADPLNALAVSDLSVVTKSQVIAAVAVAAQIDELIDDLPASAPSEVAEWSTGLDVRSNWSALGDTGSPRSTGATPDEAPSTEEAPSFEPMPSSAPADGIDQEHRGPEPPALSLAPERSSSPAASDDAPPPTGTLHEKIAALVEELVADASRSAVAELEAEAERLRAELAAEGAEREALQRAREDDDSSRQEKARALDETSAHLERATLEADRLRTELAYARAEAERLRAPAPPPAPAAAPEPAPAPEEPYGPSVPPPGTG